MIDLYDWQDKDAAKLANVFGGLDNCDMGTGKTYKAARIADLRRTHDGRVLWVGPLSTLLSSMKKCEEMGINCPMIRVDVKNRNRSWNQFVQGQPGIFFLHWEGVRLLADELATESWDYIIADEVQRAQNRKTGHTKALKKIKKVGGKLGLSGTAITGTVDKYWSVLNWLYPKQYTSYWRFFNRYVDYEIKYGPRGQYKEIIGYLHLDELLEQLAPFTVRHLKKGECCDLHPDGVYPDLGDKYYDEIIVELGPEQRKAYDGMRNDMLAWVGEHGNEPVPAPIAIAQHTRMHQFACAYATVNGSGEVQLSEPSAKIDAVLARLEDNPTQRFVIWSQFKQLIYLLKARLDKAKISNALYTGDNPETRHNSVTSFAKGNVQVFAGTITSGGTGVDGLQDGGSTMIFLDRQFPTTANIQAEDRLWRDGQSNAVQVIDVLAADTHDAGRKLRLATTYADIRKILGDRG